ncbi:hypothetical protein OE88DRAFT_1651445 [Heliocybe sulcata]|uniref:Uncharacterized protein n=1 Tax=Heliocybe sulcata TaxID=5364 RepID=A0A5C3NL48_9AGAM|nr:hypothetical protein OE88DRAFT_1651445 [Heliocybe sulcata]
MADYYYDNEPTPRNIASYVASRKRVANWVKSHATQPHTPSDYFYSPSQPPSRVPSFLSDSSGAVHGDDEYDNESIYSVPPKMVLKFDDGRADVVIEPSVEKKDLHARPSWVTRGRSVSASNVLPPKPTIGPTVRPTYLYDYGPPTPVLPEQIRILPPLQPNPHTQNTAANTNSAPRLNNLLNTFAEDNVVSYEKAQTIRPSSPKLGLSFSEPLSARFGYAPQSQPQTKDIENAAPQPQVSMRRKGASSDGNASALDRSQSRDRQYAERRQQPAPKSRPPATRTASHPAPPGVAFSHSAPARLQSTGAGESWYHARPPGRGDAPASTQRGRPSDVQPDTRQGLNPRNYRSKSLPPPPQPDVRANVRNPDVPPRSQSRASVRSRGYQEPQPERRLRARFEDDATGPRNEGPARYRARARHDSLTSDSETYHTGPGPGAGKRTQYRIANSTQMSPSLSTSSTQYSPALSRPSTSGSGSVTFKKPFLQRFFPVGKLFDTRKAGRGRDWEQDAVSREDMTTAARARLARRHTGRV